MALRNAQPGTVWHQGQVMSQHALLQVVAPAVPLTMLGWAAAGLATAGFLFETVADIQKFNFKQKNKSRCASPLLWLEVPPGCSAQPVPCRFMDEGLSAFAATPTMQVSQPLLLHPLPPVTCRPPVLNHRSCRRDCAVDRTVRASCDARPLGQVPLDSCQPCLHGPAGAVCVR